MVRRDVDYGTCFFNVSIGVLMVLLFCVISRGLGDYHPQLVHERKEHFNTLMALAEARSTMNDMRVAHEGLTASLAQCKDALAAQPAPPLPRTLGYVHTETPIFTAITVGQEKRH